MKKTYIVPSQLDVELQANNMMALSMQGGTADPDKEVLTKENDDLDFWDDEDDSNVLKDPKFF
ncbi:MAG: hypothetical protein IKW91_02795 [Bacteroidaceae bacterium]|nr:hypothetical protein [Bacteroidaceae bacterium]